jgi:hypothetical protein
MRRATVLACAIALFLPARASAWGYVGHRLIMSRAIDLLPAPLKPFFLRHRDEIVARAIDPDLWRTAGWDDDPHHFVNFGVREYGEYPFNELPHEYGAAIEKFGPAVLRKNGLLPWRTAEEFGNLRRAFAAFARTPANSTSDIILFAPVAAHYIQDAHQPLHATNNYDGHLTGNDGVHARFERELVERFQSTLRITPAAARPMSNSRDAAFSALLSSYKLVPMVLDADTEAHRGKTAYDDVYYNRFFSRVRQVLEERLSDSVTATAALIIGAWEQAGRPTLSD